MGGFGLNNPAEEYQDGVAKSLERIANLKLAREPGSGFQYSSLGYIVLGELAQRISGVPFDKFCRERIFEPIGMRDTGFNPLKGPNAKPAERIAPTSHRAKDKLILGEVHDPRAYGLAGVAGHAGLFSTADDVARFARMLFHGGELDGKRILKPETVKLMITPRKVPGGSRNYGWDVDTAMSHNRGTAFPRGTTFGHTGFTGTSIWIDPASKCAVILLTSRLHPNEKGNVEKLRGQVATILGAALLQGK